MTKTRAALGVSMAIVFLALCSGPSADQQPPPGRGGGRGGGRGAAVRQRKAVLAWADTRNGIAQHDSVSHALAVIERLGYESGAYDTYIRTDSNIISKQPLMTTGQPASGGPSLSNVDAIFFLGHREIALAHVRPVDARHDRVVLGPRRSARGQRRHQRQRDKACAGGRRSGEIRQQFHETILGSGIMPPRSAADTRPIAWWLQCRIAVPG